MQSYGGIYLRTRFLKQVPLGTNELRSYKYYRLYSTEQQHLPAPLPRYMALPYASAILRPTDSPLPSPLKVSNFRRKGSHGPCFKPTSGQREREKE